MLSSHEAVIRSSLTLTALGALLQVEPYISSMNRGDCFILDANHDIYVYVGKGAKRMERIRAISAANMIRDQDHGGRSRVHIVGE